MLQVEIPPHKKRNINRISSPSIPHGPAPRQAGWNPSVLTFLAGMSAPADPWRSASSSSLRTATTRRTSNSSNSSNRRSAYECTEEFLQMLALGSASDVPWTALVWAIAVDQPNDSLYVFSIFRWDKEMSYYDLLCISMTHSSFWSRLGQLPEGQDNKVTPHRPCTDHFMWHPPQWIFSHNKVLPQTTLAAPRLCVWICVTKASREAPGGVSYQQPATKQNVGIFMYFQDIEQNVSVFINQLFQKRWF